MKKRILSLLLALCMVVGMLPMVVLAEEAADAKTANLTVTTGNNDVYVQWKPALSEGMEPAYAKTTAEGALVLEGATADDYNLKAEWPVDGKPTLTLNNAILANDTIDPDDGIAQTVYPVISVTGTADFLFLLVGTNVVYTNHASGDTTMSASRAAYGISANNTGTLTISSQDVNVDTLLFNAVGGVSIYKSYANLYLDSANVSIQMRNTGSNAQFGISMNCYSATYADTTNLIVTNSNLSITGPGGYYGNIGIILSKGTSTKDTDINVCTSDILFQNSKIYMHRNNGTSVNSAGSELIKYSSASTCVIDNCDFEAHGRHRTVRYAPEFKNCINVQHRTDWSTWSDYAFTPGASVSSNTNNSALRATHICCAGEPVIEKAGTCSTFQDSVTYCTMFFCGKELSRETIEITDPEQIHTPGNKVELTDQRVGVIGTGTMSKLGLVPKSEGSSYYKPATGKYVFQHTCSVCGETWTEEEEFKPAILFFLSSGKGSYYEGGGYYNYNTAEGNNTSSSYKPTVAIGPGQVKYYTTGEYDANNPGYSYMKALTNESEIAAGNWNVKFEYPLYGTPILTLKDATIINNAGLWYGYAGYRDLAPLTIVLEGENNLEQRYSTTGCGPLTLQTNNDVTITGDGTLNLVSYGQGRGLAILDGHLTLDNIDLTMTRANNFVGSTRGQAIGSRTNGSVTVNGGSITYRGFGKTTSASKTDEETGVTTVTNTFTSGHTSLLQGKNVTINGATITAVGTFASSDSASSGIYKGIIYATENLTITESTLFLAHGFAYEKNDTDTYVVNTFETDVLRCGGTLTLNYANGVTGQTANVYTYANAHIGVDPTFPATTSAINSVEDVIAAKTHVYMQIAPTKEVEKFQDTSITLKDSLDVNFAVATDKIAAGDKVIFTVNDTTIEKDLTEVGVAYNGGSTVITLPGVAAKNLGDTITVTVVDEDGKPLTNAKTDSAKDYLLRLLRKPEHADDAELRTLIVDTLIYASMAQVQFGYNTENLVTADLTPAEWALATKDLVNVEAKAATTTNTGYIGTSFILEDNVRMAIAVSKNIVGAGAKATITFEDHKGTIQTEELEIDPTYSSSSAYVFITNKPVAADGRCDITFTVTNAAGETVIVVTDSMVNYVGRMIDKYPYLESLMKYSDAAKAYFTKVI